MSNNVCRDLVRKTRRFGDGANARGAGEPRRVPQSWGHDIEGGDDWLAGWDWMAAQIGTILNDAWRAIADLRMPGEPELIVRKGALVGEALYLQGDGSWTGDLDAARRFTDREWACEVADDFAKGDNYIVIDAKSWK